MPSLDPLQQSMVDDFGRIIGFSPTLKAAYDALPDTERRAVDNHFLEWAWQCVLAGSTISSRELPEQDMPEFIRAFGGFVLGCQQGKRVVFKTSDFVAMDRTSYETGIRKS